MTPKVEFVKDGRANPRGVPVLYLALKEATAISEVRPWIGSVVSVGTFRLSREIKIVDCSEFHGNAPWGHIRVEDIHENGDRIPAKDEIIKQWTYIDNAFSEPVSNPNDGIDYVPTQILSELFKSLNYDGIAYKSNFNEIASHTEAQPEDNGYNIALFDIKSADLEFVRLRNVKSISLDLDKEPENWSYPDE